MIGVPDGLHVLVVDEDDDSAASLAILLKRCGHAAQEPAPLVALLGCDAALQNMVATLPLGECPVTMSFDAFDSLAVFSSDTALVG